MNKDQDSAIGRRHLLRRAGTVAAGLAGTAAVGAAAAGPAQAAPGQPVLQGQVNEAGTPTTLRGGSATSATLRLENPTITNMEGVEVASPALRLTPNGESINQKSEMGSIAMDRSGTIWAVTSEAMPSETGNFVEYIRTETNTNQLVPVVPQRVIDTRTAAGRARIVNPAGNLDSSGRLLRGRTIQVNLDEFVYSGQAVYGNVTVTGALAAGFLQVYPHSAQRPLAFSTINFQAGQTLSNFFLTGISPVIDYISVHAQQTTHVILDVVAFVVAAGRVNPAILPTDDQLATEDQRTQLAGRTKPSWAK
ncbi:hypothetical protein GA0074696_0624 [Micromonospora purpureochromogenes]|uniref:Uncharacterized protein n=1 Tax=Micromonospora purpureochromogenes TaxID=47872 RepID=A0A1C4UTW9_9ACTN|nr:hypothetical protein [Micromonospora purpureochromogenes]SCE75128.1 hypothetical protein GA0074696_0624 [Micromonospora purpureochromogenes]